MLNSNQKQCDAKSKRSQQRCKNPAIVGAEKCRMHGAKSLAGQQSPRYKSGLFSAYLPKDLRKQVEVLFADQKRVDTVSEIHLITARIQQLLSRIDNSNERQEKALWNQIDLLIERKRKLVLAELSRERVELSFVPLPQVMVMIDIFLNAIDTELHGLPQLATVKAKIHHHAKTFVGAME